MFFNYHRNRVFQDEVHNKIDNDLKGSRMHVTKTSMSNVIYFIHQQVSELHTL